MPFPRPRGSGLHGSVCEFAVMAHLPVSGIIHNLSGLLSVKAVSLEAQSSPFCELRLLGADLPSCRSLVSIQDSLPLQTSGQQISWLAACAGKWFKMGINHGFWRLWGFKWCSSLKNFGHYEISKRKSHLWRVNPKWWCSHSKNFCAV